VSAFTKNFIRNFNQNKKAISGSHFISAVFKVAVCCFIIGDIDDCTEILNKLFNEVGDTENKTAVNHARLLYVMAHAELGNYSLLPGLVQSCINYLKKHDQYGKAEKLILKHFNELARTTKKAELKVWFTEFEQTLNILRQNRETSLIFELLPYELWVEGRV
jgi:hypothetical protein